MFQRLEWGSGLLGSDVSFVKLSLEGRAYLPLTAGVLALRRGGEHQGIGRYELCAYFQALFHRWKQFREGVSLPETGPLDDAGNPLGGLTVLEGNLDWRFPLKDSWEGVLFLDAGNVYPRGI